MPRRAPCCAPSRWGHTPNQYKQLLSPKMGPSMIWPSPLAITCMSLMERLEVYGTSPALGLNAGLNNQLPVFTNPDGSWLVGVGGDVAVLTYRVESLSDTIFANGFEGHRAVAAPSGRADRLQGVAVEP